jgi:pyrroloquinoline quinone (PQQ) biosynthesis protein C
MRFFFRLQAETEADRNRLTGTRIIRDALQGRIRLPQYVAFLTEAYHHVKHTVPLLMACGGRLPARLDWLRVAMAEYIKEEIGHDEWILSDIAACGGDAQRVRRGQPGLETELMVAYAYHQVDRGNPAGFLGMVHVLEGTSQAIATNAAAAIQGTLGLPDAAFSYLASHGSLDQKHVKFFEDVVNRLEDPPDQAAVIHCARAIYRLYGDIFRSLPQFDAPGVKEATT